MAERVFVSGVHPTTSERSRAREAPLVSVIVPSYNTGTTIGRAIESVAKTQCSRLELLIVDDGSVDDSLQVIEDYQTRYPWIRLLTHSGHQNHGIAATRNFAISNASGKYIAFLDADDTFLANRFDVALSIMEADDTVNVVCEPYRLIHVSGKRSDAMQADTTGRLLDFGSDDERFLHALQHGGMPHTSSVTIRRSALLDTGLFPPLKYCLEKPLWLKLFSLGGVRPGSTEPVACYYLHDDSTCATHQDTAAFRFEDVAALLDVYRWMKQRGMANHLRDAVHDRAFGKYLHYSTYARALRHRMWGDVCLPPLAVLKTVPQAALRWRFWVATGRMLLGRTTPRHAEM